MTPNLSALSIADVLDRAADILSAPGAWGQGGYYRSQEREVCVARERADCFCVVGAMTIAAGRDAYPAEIEHGEIGTALIAALPEGATKGKDGERGIYVWNDAPGRTQAEVVAALKQAASLAREQSA